ncbi:hydrogenase maturation protease [Streptomyces sp. NPDC004111]|uniref:hydrogenase maturation protease n=1 Tax=Streptomyces sp. NPDC004111 TaxID=3364690 RepID=UPI0036B7DEE5
MSARPRIAVIGVGNEFRRDDGVGPAVIARLRTRYAKRGAGPDFAGGVADEDAAFAGRTTPAEPDFAVCDGEPARLIGLWEGADLAFVVDAAHAHPAVPGRVHRLELDAVTPDRPSGTSSHGLGLGEAVELARILGRLPSRLVVYAVEGGDTGHGPGLSPAVASAAVTVARRIEHEVEAREHPQRPAPQRPVPPRAVPPRPVPPGRGAGGRP